MPLSLPIPSSLIFLISYPFFRFHAHSPSSYSSSLHHSTLDSLIFQIQFHSSLLLPYTSYPNSSSLFTLPVHSLLVIAIAFCLDPTSPYLSILYLLPDSYLLLLYPFSVQTPSSIPIQICLFLFCFSIIHISSLLLSSSFVLFSDFLLFHFPIHSSFLISRSFSTSYSISLPSPFSISLFYFHLYSFTSSPNGGKR